MTLEQAFKQFSESDEFKSIQKGSDTAGSRFRLYLSRFNKGTLKAGAMVEILQANGYEIKANKVTKKK